MLIDLIKNHQVLLPFYENECEENGIAIDIHPDVDRTSILIIKIDKYFNKTIHPNPSGPDCLVVQRCNDSKFRIFIVELKDIEDLKSYSLSKIREKFQNCLNIFMSDAFRDCFYSGDCEITSISLVFISSTKEQQRRGVDKKQKNTRLDTLLALPPCKFADRRYYIDFKEPNPLIFPC